MHMLHKKIALISTIFFATIGQAAYATYFDREGVFFSSGLSTKTPTEIMFAIIQYVLGLLAIITLVLVIYSGFLIMTASGSEERVQKGMVTLKWTVLGLLIIMSSWGIVLLIDQIIQQAS